MHGALVARTTEAVHDRLEAVGHRRRTSLLQADYVAPEAEAEVAGVRSRYLLSRVVGLTFVLAGRLLRHFLVIGLRAGRRA